MQEIKLKKLSLHNFKGCRSFVLDAQGSNCSVYGDNGTCKTTLMDAFLWALFGKDSMGQSIFEIKTLTPDGEPIHGLNHTVEPVLSIDGQDLKLKKTYRELWQKKRGAVKETFTGHTTEYWVQEVPCKKSEYESRISKLIDEDVFRLLTDPRYFNSLHWQKRRTILMEVCGDIADSEVINSDKSLAALPAILKDRKLEEHKKVITARRSEINKELEKIPVRIDEVAKSLPDVSGINPAAITADIATRKGTLKELREQVARIEGGGEVADKMKQLREAEAELLNLQNRHRGAFEIQIREKQGAYRAAQEQAENLQRTIRALKADIEQAEEVVARANGRRATLRAEWTDIKSQEFNFDAEDTCPACGQSLPEDKVKAAIEKAREEFNLAKAKKLETISAEGKALATIADNAKADIDEYVKKRAEAQTKLTEHENTVASLKAEIEVLCQQAENYATAPAYIAKQKEIEELRAAIAGLKEGRTQEVSTIQEDISRIEAEVSALETQLLQVSQYEQGQKRIKELSEQERTLAAEYEKLEGEVYLTEQFIVAKVKLLTDKINGKFKIARFKMFNELVNGGIDDKVCEVLCGGVPYSSGLNNAARINVGLDIINTLAEHYKFAPPVFIDNAEAITRLTPTRGQQIRLVVSEADKELRVEYNNTITDPEILMDLDYEVKEAV